MALKYSNKFLNSLDILRGMAAIYVMIAHARWILWEGYSTGFLNHPEKYNFIEKLLMYFILGGFRFAHEAVIFFFILSGFVIHLKQAKKFQFEGQYQLSFWSFLLKRIKRIYPPYLLIILLTFICDKIGVFLYPNLYHGQTFYTLNFLDINLNFDIYLLVKNLLFIQNGMYEMWGTCHPIWSLQMEWWFYLFYPIIFFFFKRSFLLKSSFAILVLLTGFLLQIYTIPYGNILKYFIIWWLGVVIAELYIRDFKRTKYIAIILIALSFIAILFTDRFIKDFFIGIGICGALIAIYKFKSYTILNKFKFFGWVSHFSYTLYILHFPVFMLLAAYYMTYHNGNLPQKFHLMFTGIGLSILLAYIIHLLVEKPFTKNK